MKGMRPCFPGTARLCRHSQRLQPYTRTHLFQKFLRHRFTDCNGIFLFVRITRSQNLIYHVPLIRHQKESFRILIEAPYRINAPRISEKIHDIFSMIFVRCRTYNPFRLVNRQEYRSLFSANRLTIADYRLPRHNPHAHARRLSVHQDFSRLNEAVRLTPGTDPGVTQILI